MSTTDDRMLAALLHVERAAREADAFFGGRPGRWTFDRRVLGERSSTALLSLRDYLNDIEAERRQQASDG